MGKWISTSAAPGNPWYLDKAIDMVQLREDVEAERTVTLRLVSGGTLVIRPDQVAVLAYGED